MTLEEERGPSLGCEVRYVNLHCDGVISETQKLIHCGSYQHAGLHIDR